MFSLHMLRLPAYIVLSATGQPRRMFRKFRIIAGATQCILLKKPA
jgi:hypothetical protein